MASRSRPPTQPPPHLPSTPPSINTAWGLLCAQGHRRFLKKQAGPLEPMSSSGHSGWAQGRRPGEALGPFAHAELGQE